ncbi:MAG: hypothetical protein IRZ32_12620 [Solirubrobacteraceae bacterium]|nr:hypothetical protein [Solirubrobacteraceae bacterium]
MADRRRKRRKRPTAPAATAVCERPAPEPAAPRAQPRASRRARLEDAPKAPWSPFPLIELTILAGIVLLVLGLAGVAADRVAFSVCGFALVAVASLELSLREHFAGYRSHSTLLAAGAAVLAVIPLHFFTGLPRLVLAGVGVAVFAACFAALRAAFRRRTGGIGFRL